MTTPTELLAAVDAALLAVADVSAKVREHLAAEVDIEFPPVDPPPAPPAPAPERPPPAPAPEPATPPAPVPPPEPPRVPKPAPQLMLRPVTGSVAVSCCGWNEGGATYDRQQSLVEWIGGKGSLTIWRNPLAAVVTLPTRTFTVTVGGSVVGEVSFPEGKMWARLEFSTLTLPDGWVRVQCTGLVDGEWAPEEWAYNRLSAAQPTTVPKWTDSHHRPENPAGFVQASCWVPAVYAPKPVPLAVREFKPVSDTTPVRAQVLTRMEPSGTLYVPNISKHGTVSTATKQAYFWGSTLLEFPDVPLLDGPRGVGTLPLVVHLEVGMAAPDGVPRRTWYAATSWGIVRGRPDGSITTLVGWRHAGMASHWADGKDQRTLELVGDWRCQIKGFHAIRGFCFDQASLAVDESLPRIPGEDGAPHPNGPVMYVAEQRRSCIADVPEGRIVRVEFSTRGHDITPIVTEFATGLRGSWGVQDWGGQIIVSERNANRIIAIDKATKAVTVLLAADPERPGAAEIQQNSIPKLTGTLEERRAQPCLAPEDLKTQDGWLYFSSFGAECVKRFNMDAMKLDADYLLPVEMDRQSWAVKFAISDGTFGPRGTIFASTWGQSHHAGAYGIKPDGTRFTAHSKAAPWAAIGYPFGVAVGDSRMYVTSSNMGLTRYSAALPGEQPINAETYRLGRRAWDAMHGDIRFGPGPGFGDFAHDLPWGEDEAVDYVLTMHDLPR